MPNRTMASLRPRQISTNGFHQIRTFRWAVAASGEYTEFHGGTAASAMAAITTLSARVNQIYEEELGIRLVLVTNNSLVVYTNKDTDPFTSLQQDSVTIREAQETFDLMIGNQNYDLGILLNTGTYGLTPASSVCNSSIKGKACMGLPQPVGEIFYTYVAHEIAHQFGAAHTFNARNGICSSNRYAPSAMEPGTGSTMMSYAGLECGPGSLAPFMDPYFHAQSIFDIETFIADTTLCGKIITTSNHPPTVAVGTNYFIPKLTPFQLTATGSDLDGDALTYCWEEMDVGPAQTFADPDNGASPLFRSFPPGTNSLRIFPTLNSILQNTNSLGEKLPSLSRVMKFRVTVRDAQMMGAKNFADTQVQVVSSAGPFRLTSHNVANTFGGQQIIQWDVAGTAAAPINVQQVNLLLSTNGGQNFPIVLASNTANDGAESVIFPNVNRAKARLKIEAVANIFFDINDAEIAVESAPYFTRIQRSGGEILLRWTHNPAKNSQLQTTADLRNPTWQNLEIPLIPNGDEMEATVPIEGGAIFRVREF